MGMHDTRRCACNKVFQLPSLMSRQAQCYDCLRAEAVAVMEARKGEARPAGVGGMLKAAGDVCATGMDPAVARRTQAIHAAIDRVEARRAADKPASAKVDVMRDPLPPTPRTREEAEALLKAGWWLRTFVNGAPGGITLAMRDGSPQFRDRDRDGKWLAGGLFMWVWPGHTDPHAPGTCWFHPIRPPSPPEPSVATRTVRCHYWHVPA
jgi:hypothetical protein